MVSLPSPGTQFTVQVTDINDMGQGTATTTRWNNTPVEVFVKGAFPGDEASCVVEKVFAKRPALLCRATSILAKGPSTCERTCQHAAPCPACPLHGLKLRDALSLKKKRIENAFNKEQVKLPVPIEDVLAQESEFDYRQKAKLMIGGKPGLVIMGHYIPGTHRLLPAHLCPYHHPSIRAAAVELLEVFNKNPIDARALGLKAAILRATTTQPAAIIVATQPLNDDLYQAICQLVDDNHLVCFHERIVDENTNNIIGGTVNRRYGPTTIMPLDGLEPCDPDSFCQADPIQADKMYKLVADYLTKENTNGVFVDAYAGTGGFSKALLANGATRIIAIESAPNSFSALQQLPVEAHLTSVEDAFLHQLKSCYGIVADPPPRGLFSNATNFAQLQAERFVLVSCNPDAMARDVKQLMSQGYSVDQIIPIDLFAGTPEIETIVFLRRS